MLKNLFIIILCLFMVTLLIFVIRKVEQPNIPTSSQHSQEYSQEPQPPAPPTPVFSYSLFSWGPQVMEPQERELLVSTMNSLDIQMVYQWFSKDVEDQKLIEFTTHMAQQGKEVYVLTGDPSWAYEENLSSLLAVIDRAHAVGGVKGVVIDVEPGQLDEYDTDRDNLMEEFAANMQAAYTHAKSLGFEVVICISAHWDDEPTLEQMIRDSCDAVCVMNYYVQDEYDTIEKEAEYAMQYGKELINASELQPTGDHGIEEKNTYYTLGIDAMHEAWQTLWDQLHEDYGVIDIGFSYHNYEYLKEAIEKDQSSEQ